MGIKSIDRNLCVNCGDCVADCPMDVLRMDESGKVYIAYVGDCMDCFTCQQTCPVNAIEVSPESTKQLWFSFDIEKHT